MGRDADLPGVGAMLASPPPKAAEKKRRVRKLTTPQKEAGGSEAVEPVERAVPKADPPACPVPVPKAPVVEERKSAVAPAPVAQESKSAAATAKEKRQAKARLGYQKLVNTLTSMDAKELKLPGPELTSMSWTAVHPDISACRIGIVLNQEAFYINRVGELPLLLRRHLQVGNFTIINVGGICERAGGQERRLLSIVY